MRRRYGSLAIEPMLAFILCGVAWTVGLLMGARYGRISLGQPIGIVWGREFQRMPDWYSLEKKDALVYAIKHKGCGTTYDGIDPWTWAEQHLEFCGVRQSLAPETIVLSNPMNAKQAVMSAANPTTNTTVTANTGGHQ